MKKFLLDASGNVAMIAAIVAIPVMLGAGAAVDYSSVVRKNQTLQSAVDAAILAVSHEAMTSKKKELKKAARKHLKANLSKEHFKEINKIQLIFEDDKSAIRLDVTAKHPTTIMQLAGIPTLPYSPTAKVNLAGGSYEIALVLDSTYSMSADNKMNDLKSSASKFIEDLTAFNHTSDRVKMGIVPFSKYVNVGVSNAGASWLDVPPTTTENVCWTHTPVISKSGCTTNTYYNDGVPYQAESCSNTTYGEPKEICRDITSKWNGCVGSRKEPLNIRDKSYGKRVPGILNEYCGNPVTPLTASKSDLLDAVDALVPSGDTYIPAGLTWGLRVLSSKAPFTGGLTYKKAKNTDTTKVVILMSDGENVRSAQIPGAPTHNGSDVDQANEFTEEACDEIKSLDMVIFTIGFGTAIPAATEAILRDCSTDGANYYPAADGAALASAFDAISSQLSAVYLSE